MDIDIQTYTKHCLDAPLMYIKAQKVQIMTKGNVSVLENVYITLTNAYIEQIQDTGIYYALADKSKIEGQGIKMETEKVKMNIIDAEFRY